MSVTELLVDEWPLVNEEAGHSTMAHGLGRPLGPVEIRADGTGRAWIGKLGEPVPIADAIAVLDALDVPTRNRLLREKLWIALAGPAADHIVRGLTAWDGRNDREVIHACCVALEVPPWTVFPRVQELLRSVWPAVDALATELACLRRVEGRRCEEILAKHITRGCWTEEITR